MEPSRAYFLGRTAARSDRPSRRGDGARVGRMGEDDLWVPFDRSNKRIGTLIVEDLRRVVFECVDAVADMRAVDSRGDRI